MICVSIGRDRQHDLLAEHKRLVEQGAQLVELRLDYLHGPIEPEQLLHNRPGPVIVTLRRPQDGGKFHGSEAVRWQLLSRSIAAGADYVDLEEEAAARLPRSGSTKRIVSLHDFHETPDDLPTIHARLAALDADVVKICTTANHPDDNFRMLSLVEQSRVPTVGLCMGDIGIPTRILCGRFGAPFSYATVAAEQALAPGQLSFEQMSKLYRYDQIDRHTEVYGVIADPVGHSLSPLIHNTAFAHLKLNKVYLPIRVPPEDLARFMDGARRMGICGLSVTIPHKEAVIDKLDEVDAAVRGIGAANTVIFDGQRRRGYNTDCPAAIESLEQAMGGAAGGKSPLDGKTALILGAGGVGKAIAVGLIDRGARVVLADGLVERADELAGRLNCRSVPWSRRHEVTADILINGTPLGMHPKVDETPYDTNHLRQGMVVFDAVYNPENTLLIEGARSQHCKVVTGVDMFVRQACLQFKMFTGQDGPADLMREVVQRATAAARH